MPSRTCQLPSVRPLPVLEQWQGVRGRGHNPAWLTGLPSAAKHCGAGLPWRSEALQLLPQAATSQAASTRVTSTLHPRWPLDPFKTNPAISLKPAQWNNAFIFDYQVQPPHRDFFLSLMQRQLQLVFHFSACPHRSQVSVYLKPPQTHVKLSSSSEVTNLDRGEGKRYHILSPWTFSLASVPGGLLPWVSL